jgi:PAS domain S-box-containing protein
VSPHDLSVAQESLRILHLEDSELEAQMIAGMLSDAGLAPSIVRARTREEYVSALRGRPVDLILSDYTMPGFDGLSALDLAREAAPGVPFIFVSGTLGEERAVEGLKRGATDYVLKGRLERLVPAVRGALTAVRAREARARAEAAGRLAQLAFQQAPVALCATGRAGHIEVASAAFGTLHGYRVEELIGQNVSRLHSARELREELAPLAERARREGSASGEVGRRRKDGSAFRSWTAVSALGDGRGEVRGFVICARAITGDARGPHGRGVLPAMSRLAAATRSPQAAVPALLQAVCEIGGFDLSELWWVQGEPPRLIFGAAWHDPRDTVVARISASARTLEFARGTGLLGRVWAAAEPEWMDQGAAGSAGLHTAFLLPLWAEGAVVGILACFGREIRSRDAELWAMARDLGEAMGALAGRLRGSSEATGLERLGDIVQCLPLALYAASLDGTRLTWIAGDTEGLTGFPAERLIEEPHLRWSRIHGEDQRQVWATLSRVQQTKRADIEYRWVRPDGEPIHLLEHVTVTQATDGRPVGLAGLWVRVRRRR